MRAERRTVSNYGDHSELQDLYTTVEIANHIPPLPTLFRRNDEK